MTEVQPRDMKVMQCYPPNVDDIKRVFPFCMQPGVMFCYGNTIYSPSSIYVPPAIVAHESVHATAQMEIGVTAWWDEYLVKKEFRFEEEYRAFLREYVEFCKAIKTRQRRREYLASCASRLASPLYGEMETFEVCKAKISQDAEKYI